MLKKTITYNDLDGNPVTEDFYFNLSHEEIAVMELSQEGGLSNQLKKVIAAGDGKTILATFREILAKSYGKRSEDGRRFIKSPELFEEFTQTQAYSTLFMDLVTNAQASTEFIRGIMPVDIVEKIEIDEAVSEIIVSNKPVENVPLIETKVIPKDPSKMTRAELLAAYKQKVTELTKD